MTTHWSRTAGGWRCARGPIAAAEELDQADYTACMLGLRDYVDKNRFPGVVLGLSGGVDSALCAALAVDALGADRVRCVMLPYRFTSQESLDDAAAVAARARRPLRHRADRKRGATGSKRRWRGIFAGAPRDVTEENLQARARGTILMAISNKFGLMVVTTGNKSEMSVGYATLYGDMNGGFNPIKDLYKTEVFRLARLRNRWKPDGALGPDGPVIPENVHRRARRPRSCARTRPTRIRCRPTTCSTRSSSGWSSARSRSPTIVAAGFDRETVMKVERMLNLAEYKRRQAAPGVKVTLKNFGRDRRYPITNRFRDPGTELPAPDRAPVKGPATAKAGAADF